MENKQLQIFLNETNESLSNLNENKYGFIPSIPQIKISYSNSLKFSKMVHITKSENAYDVFKYFWNQDKIQLQEEMLVMLLNNDNRVLGIFHLSTGDSRATIASVKIIASTALLANAQGLVIAHNHPSGNCIPSEADKNMTRKLAQGLEILDMKLLDHLIITSAGYYSLADNGDF